MTPSTVDAYLAAIPAERATALAAVRAIVRESLPAGFEEAIQYGMIAYRVPAERYPATYNGQPLTLACLASQKSYMVLYLMSIYGDPALETWFLSEYRASGKRLDVGKSCVRFRSIDDLPLALVGKAIAKVSVDVFIGMYEAARAKTKGGLVKKPVASEDSATSARKDRAKKTATPSKKKNATSSKKKTATSSKKKTATSSKKKSRAVR